MANIKISALEVYHPKTVVDNEYYIEHFKKQGKDIEGLLQHLGRSKRYQIAGANENTLTMAVEATRKVLAKAGLTGEDLDLILFSTQSPEQTIPTNAIMLHHEINGKHECLCYDSNANCAGMTIAVEQLSHYMKSNPKVQRALIVGSDYNSILCSPENELTYPLFGDAAAALILERTEEDCGVIDTIYYTDSNSRTNIMYPSEGFKKLLKGESDKYMRFVPFNGEESLPAVYQSFERIFEAHHLQPEDIRAYCLSQFSLSNVLKIKEKFNLQDEQILFVGDEYGYTATTSPFLSFYKGIETGQIKRGDYVMFWTIGGGFQIISMLIKY